MKRIRPLRPKTLTLPLGGKRIPRVFVSAEITSAPIMHFTRSLAICSLDPSEPTAALFLSVEIKPTLKRIESQLSVT